MAYWLSIMGSGSLGLSTRSVSNEHCPAEITAQEAEEALALGLDWVVVTQSDEPPYAPGYSKEAANGPMTLSDFRPAGADEEVTEAEVEKEAADPSPEEAAFACQAEGCDKTYPSQAALDFHVDNAHADAPAEEPAPVVDAPADEPAPAPADDQTPPDSPAPATE